MTFSSLVGIALTLALVLGLLAVTMRLLRKVSQGGTLGRSKGGVPLEVVQRIALGPRQGIAVVRIGEQLVAVSVGEGGVRTLAELEPAEATAPAVVHEPLSGVVQSPAMGGTRDFRTALMHGLRSAGLPLVIAAMTATALASQRVSAQATQRPATPAATPSTGTAAPRATPPRTQPPRGATASPATVAQPQRALGAAPAAPASQAASTSLDDALGKAIPKLDLSVDGSSPGGLRLSGSVGIVIMMGLLTLLPTLVLMMTSFTRILIVLQFLKQALGTQTAPPAQVVSALALLLTGFVMAPTMTQVNRVAITPWLDGQIEQGAMMKNALGPMRDFMLRQTRERDIAAFVDMAGGPAPARPEDVSTIVLTSAFVTSELRTAFQLGFVLFLPFIVIDIVVSSVLMSMGMFMLPPAMIALPFKLLLFVLVDGWSLLIQSLVQGFK
ncbi:MAG: flagellar type III secretion system pore protein FliP [Gemmatimonadetes bacterium]|nr:flagellar type III secretion system pore protein FliP [Gemmatimonadota bacterium]MBK9977697.1 flagellar type III secretion system pore protein FliP [Gemmatimonadota bacterium]HNV73878.1 flagellar type III secretion system pore protein FliP [Gemmatimonadaceae bacterium]